VHCLLFHSPPGSSFYPIRPSSLLVSTLPGGSTPLPTFLIGGLSLHGRPFAGGTYSLLLPVKTGLRSGVQPV
jgi:hypothetical protein